MTSQTSRKHYIFTVLLVAILTALQFSGNASPVAQIRLPGYVPTGQATTARFVGDTDPGEEISLAIVLSLRNEVSLDNSLRRLYDPKDEEYGRYVTPEEFTERYGPSASDYAEVEAFAKASGFKIIGTHRNRLILDVKAPAQIVEATFGTNLRRYQDYSGRIFRAPSANPQIPAHFKSLIACIIGLDNITVRRPFNQRTIVNTKPLSSTLSTGSVPYSPRDISLAYGLYGSYLTGFGQSLGLFEQDGYNPSDIQAYEAAYGGNVPVRNVLIDGVQNYPQTLNGSAEVTLDIELQIALAPNADQIVVYEGPINDQGELDTYNQIADDNIAKTISTSWGWPERANFLITAEDSIFRQMAIQGQTICAASGDSGAYADGSSLSVNNPASQPYVLGVGGTSLYTNGPGGNYNHESAWSGSGGGVSNVWPKPDYQTGLGFSTARRNVPDVALNADPNTGYFIYFGGNWTEYGGTSCAAPLWASLLALTNQQRAINGLPTLGFANPSIYKAAEGGKNYLDFHDIREGNNGYYPYRAVSGFDDSTGWGSFIGPNLIADLSEPPASSGGADDAAYVSDVTVPDKTVFRQNQAFTKVWQIKNTGSTTWGLGYKWTFDGGDQMSGPDYVSIPSTGAGATWNPSVNLRAPSTPGTYKGYWRMEAPNGQKFGDRVWVLIQVSAAGSDSATYIEDVTVPDNTTFTQNQAFTKTWRIKNTGSTTWGSGYQWTFDGGDQMGGPGSIGVSAVGPGSTWDPSISLQAPSNPGTYKGYWRMEAPNGQKFGDRVWVLIQVSRGGANVTTNVSESDAASGPDQPGFWKQGTASYWHDATGVGDGGHMYWTYNNDNAHGTDDVGFWRPNLPTTQPYEVFVFIPRNYATTKQAHYSVYAADGQHDVTINQDAYYDQWVSLGTYRFSSGTGGYLRLIDQTGEAYTSTYVGFDSAQWQPRSSIPPPTPTQAVVSESDTAPYDGAPGFFRHGTPQFWHDAAFGDGGHMYWTYNNDAAHGSDDIGDWRPSLATPGNYEVSVYIPNNYADTTQAHYTVSAADGQHDVYINQSVYFNQWVSLGTFRFSSGTGGYLRLVDQTNEKYISKWVGFDTARWDPRIGNANTPSNLQPSSDVVVSPNVVFRWQDNGMSDGNPSVNFQIQVWHVVSGQRADQVWSSDWQSGTSRAWSAPGPGEYEWVVQAGNGGNQSAASSPARFVVPVPAPDAPSGLTAEADSPTTVDLAWLDNSSNETGFQIERRSGGSAYAQIGTVGADTVGFVDTDRTPGTTYTYRVRASNNGGSSGYTDEATATTPADYPVASVSLAAQTVVGGNSVAGTVRLGGQALADGSSVTLNCSNGAVASTDPVTVPIPAGQTTADFTVNTSAVTSNTPMSITATNSVSSSSAALTVLIVPVAAVSGTVSLQGVAPGSLAQPLTFTLTPAGSAAGSAITQNITLAADGAFTLASVPAGTYTLGVQGSKWLRKDVAVDTTGGSVTGLAVSLLGGDATGDNKVNASDFLAMRAAYGTAMGDAAYRAACDFNCDGKVNAQDFLILRSNYGKNGDP